MFNTIDRSPYWEGLSILEKYFINFPYASESTAAFVNPPESYALALSSLCKPGYVPIDFASNRWDFRLWNPERNSIHMVMLFDCDYEPLNGLLKMFAVHTLSEPSGISTTNNHMRRVKRILDKLCIEKGHLSLVNTDNIIEAIKECEKTTIRTRDIYASFSLFYSFLSSNYLAPLPVTISRITYHHFKENKNLSIIQESHKTADFSNELFKAIVTKALEVLDNPHEPLNRRSTSGMILIISQLGLRPGEGTKLKTNALQYYDCPGIEQKVPMIEYVSEKISRKNGKLRKRLAFAYPLAVHAFNKLLEIRKECPLASTHDYLYCLTPHRKTRRRYPLQARQLGDEYFIWFLTYLPEYIQTPQENIKPMKAPTAIHNGLDSTDKDHLYYCPTFTQFRVHMTTYLRNRGIDPWNAEFNVGHNSPEMYGYYAREEDKYFRRDILATEEFVSEVLQKNHVPIGANGSALVQEMKQLVQEAKIEVSSSNLDDLVNATSGRLFIRAHQGGFGYCVRLVATSCHLDTSTDDYRCAYGLCENQYHFYWIADASYQSFHKMQEVYFKDVREGKDIRASKELKGIKRFLTKRLKVEIEMLESEITSRGIETVLAERPNLKDIISNITSIKKEIQQWMKK